MVLSVLSGVLSLHLRSTSSTTTSVIPSSSGFGPNTHVRGEGLDLWGCKVRTGLRILLAGCNSYTFHLRQSNLIPNKVRRRTASPPSRHVLALKPTQPAWMLRYGDAPAQITHTDAGREEGTKTMFKETADTIPCLNHGSTWSMSPHWPKISISQHITSLLVKSVDRFVQPDAENSEHAEHAWRKRKRCLFGQRSLWEPIDSGWDLGKIWEKIQRIARGAREVTSSEVWDLGIATWGPKRIEGSSNFMT